MNDLDMLDNIMITYQTGMDEYVIRGLDNWRKNIIDQQEALRIISYERDNLEKHVEELKKLRDKLRQNS